MFHIFKSLIGSRSATEQPRRSTGAAYVVDERDRVEPLPDFPKSSVGAPTPIIVADEHSLSVVFYLEQRDPNWDGTTVRIITPDSEGEPVAVVTFIVPYAHFFGPPNDEAFSGHPLADRGLHPYGAFEVSASSWIRALERLNSVHPSHRPDHFSAYRHFILAFHDTTFECVATGFAVERHSGSLRSVLPRIITATCDYYQNA